MAFLDEKFTECIQLNSSGSITYNNYTNFDAGRSRHVVEFDPYPLCEFEAVFNAESKDWIVDNVIDLYNRSRMGADSFRFRNFYDYSSNGYYGTPTSTDQLCTEISSTEFQMVKWYGTQGDLTQSRRVIVKPVSGTGLVSDGGVTVNPADYSIDYTTGIITFGVAPSGAVAAGFYYDLPIYFASSIDGLLFRNYKTMSVTVALREDIDL